MKIRTAALGDEKSIAQVIISTWKESYKGIISQSFLDGLTTHLHETLMQKQIPDTAYTIKVLETEDHQIVGMASGGIDDTGKYDCEVIAIYIDSAYQHQGFGKSLLQEMIKAFLHKGYQSMIIWTLEKNHDRLFYHQMGGEVMETKMYPIGDENHALVGYVWENIQ